MFVYSEVRLLRYQNRFDTKHWNFKLAYNLFTTNSTLNQHSHFPPSHWIYELLHKQNGYFANLESDKPKVTHVVEQPDPNRVFAQNKSKPQSNKQPPLYDIEIWQDGIVDFVLGCATAQTNFFDPVFVAATDHPYIILQGILQNSHSALVNLAYSCPYL